MTAALGAAAIGALAQDRPGAAPPPAPRKIPSTIPSSAPATRPTTAPATPITRAFAELASLDPAVREAAKLTLMSLNADDLPELRDLVQRRRPLPPSQAVVLRDIVLQMYLADDGYESNNHDGFLGIRPSEVVVGARDPGADAGNAQANGAAQIAPPGFPGQFEIPDPNAAYGILVMERMPGFAGARSLEDGDVILGIVERPNLQFRSSTDFSLAVRAAGAGSKVHFEVLRQGRVIHVQSLLGPRPTAAEFNPVGQNPMQKLLDERRDKADRYWEKEFAPLMDEGIG